MACYPPGLLCLWQAGRSLSFLIPSPPLPCTLPRDHGWGQTCVPVEHWHWSQRVSRGDGCLGTARKFRSGEPLGGEGRVKASREELLGWWQLLPVSLALGKWLLPLGTPYQLPHFCLGRRMSQSQTGHRGRVQQDCARIRFSECLPACPPRQGTRPQFPCRLNGP